MPAAMSNPAKTYAWLPQCMCVTQNWADTVKPWKAPTCSIFGSDFVLWMVSFTDAICWNAVVVVSTWRKMKSFRPKKNVQPFYDSLLHHLTIGIVCPMGSDTFIQQNGEEKKELCFFSIRIRMIHFSTHCWVTCFNTSGGPNITIIKGLVYFWWTSVCLWAHLASVRAEKPQNDQVLGLHVTWNDHDLIWVLLSKRTRDEGTIFMSCLDCFLFDGVDASLITHTNQYLPPELTMNL